MMDMVDIQLLKNQTFEVVDNLLDNEFVNYELVDDITVKVQLLNKKTFTISIYDAIDHVQVKIIPKTDGLKVRNVTVNVVDEHSTKRIHNSIKKLIVDIEKKRLEEVAMIDDSNKATNSVEPKLKRLLKSYPSFSYSKILDRVVFDGTYYAYELIDDQLYINIMVNRKNKLMRIDSANIILNANRK